MVGELRSHKPHGVVKKKGKMRTGSANEHTGTIWQRLYISLKKIPILEQKGINRNLFVTDRI